MEVIGSSLEALIEGAVESIGSSVYVLVSSALVVETSLLSVIVPNVAYAVLVLLVPVPSFVVLEGVSEDMGFVEVNCGPLHWAVAVGGM